MRLVPDARRAWRWFSVQLATLSGVVPAAWLAVPDDMRRAIPAEWLAVAGIALAVLIVVGRLVDQEDKG